MRSLLSFLLLCLPLSAVYAASGQGKISLWSDNDCGTGLTTNFGIRDPVALEYTLSADVCGTLGAATHSYKVLQRPTCANGTTAAFAFYHGTGCKIESFGPALNNFNPSRRFDGECLALVEFFSLAFICAGVGASDGGNATSAFSSPSSVAVLSSTATLASATPIAPSLSMTDPIYTILTGSSFAGLFPTSRASSGIGPSVGFPAKPSPSSFTGAAARVSGSVAGAIVVLGGVMLF